MEQPDPVDYALYAARLSERKTQGIEDLSSNGGEQLVFPLDGDFDRLIVLELYDESDMSKETNEKLYCAWALVGTLEVKRLKLEQVERVIIPKINQANTTGIVLIKNMRVVRWMSSPMVDGISMDELAQDIMNARN